MKKVDSPKKPSGTAAKKVLLAIGIAIVFALFIGFGINTFYKEPKYENFCGPYPAIMDEKTCTAEGGNWTLPEQPEGVVYLTCTEKIANTTQKQYSCTQDANSMKSAGWCNYNERKCDKSFRDAMEPYNRNVFIISVIFGLAAIILGVTLMLGSVSAGLMAGGILTVLYGVIRYWGFAQDWLRFTILGITLAVLIWLGYKRLNK
jgi:hypothetical protein